MCGFRESVFPAFFFFTIKHSKDLSIFCERGDLWTPLYSFAPFTIPWQLRKMCINPSKLAGDFEWPGAGLWHLRSLKPDKSDLKAETFKAESVVSEAPWSFHPLCLDGFCEMRQPDKDQQIKEVTAGGVYSLWVMLGVRLTISTWWLACAEGNHFKQHMLWT